MTLKFSVPKCPECGLIADGTIDTVPAVAHLDFDVDGKAEYTGESTVWWDDQFTDEDENHEVSMYCENGHRWQSRMEDVP